MSHNDHESVFAGSQALYALTPAAAGLVLKYLAREEPSRAFISASALPLENLPPELAERVRLLPRGGFKSIVGENWHSFDGHVFVMAAGIVVRRIAGLLEHKTRDPAVVVCDEKGEFAISLLSGHIGGANRLARRVARVFGGRAVITTATDVQGLPAIDEIAARYGFKIVNPAAIKEINSLVLARRPVGVCGPSGWVRLLTGQFDERLFVLARDAAGWETEEADNLPAGQVVVGRGVEAEAEPVVTFERPRLRLLTPRLVAGIGCRRGVPRDEIEAALSAVLENNGFVRSDIACLASIELKRDEPGLIELAAAWGLPLQFFTAAELEPVAVPSPSGVVAAVTGSPSVSEAAAQLAAAGPLLVVKRKFPRVTVALAVRRRSRT